MQPSLFKKRIASYEKTGLHPLVRQGPFYSRQREKPSMIAHSAKRTTDYMDKHGYLRKKCDLVGALSK